MQPRIVEVLPTIFDPEVPVNIHELGLIYEIAVDTDHVVGVRMTLTAPGLTLSTSATLQPWHEPGLSCCAQSHPGPHGTIECMETQRRNGVDVKLAKPKAAKAAATPPEFNAQAFLDSVGIAKSVVKYGRGDAIFTQGETCDHLLYIQSGGVKLSVLSKTGKEAVVAMLGPGDFFGEGCLAGQPLRTGSATAITASAILRVRKRQMAELLHKQSAMSDRFISHLLTRNIRIEEDLIDQLFNSSEKRLARTLLLLARYGKQAVPVRMVPKISQDTLAEMVGTTRSRVNFFLNKFKKLGFIEYSGELPIKINNSLLSVVLHD